MAYQVFRAAVLNPQRTGRIQFHRDGVIVGGPDGTIAFAGEWEEYVKQAGQVPPAAIRLIGVICPPFLDAHTHIPQHPIRGKFAEGVEEEADGGRLLSGLQRNVFPTEAMAAEAGYATEVVRQFAADTLAQGVVGGAAYMTVHARASEVALRELGEAWSVGMVLMNQNCPEYLRTDEENVERDLRKLGERFGQRFIVTDRFAVAVNSELRRTAARMAREMGLRTQTHLNEQQSEKQFVEQTLYPGRTYAGVYKEDGVLDCRPIMAHCVWMGSEEWAMLRDAGAAVAHCPTSNALLGSGVMRLDEARTRGIPYAICTDVGASPTTSMLQEMTEFLRDHDGLHPSATAEEALYRSTLAPAEILGQRQLGTFEAGMPLSFVEIEPAGPIVESSAEDVIRRHLLEIGPTTPNKEIRRNLAAAGLQSPAEMDALLADAKDAAERLERKVRRVILKGSEVYRREGME